MTPHAHTNRHQPGGRLLALLLLVTLAWPSLVVCFADGPAAMPCCAKREAGAPPTARACCGETPASPATAPASVVSLLQAPHDANAFPLVATMPSQPIGLALCARPGRLDIRLLNAVFLI